MLIFKIATDGLLDTVTQIHCIVTYDTDKRTFKYYPPADIEVGIDALLNADVLIGHNIIAYDLEVLTKCYPQKVASSYFSSVYDTLIAARLGIAIDKVSDKQLGIPSKHLGSHSLDAWGYRLNVYTGIKPKNFVAYTESMLDYCKQDVTVIKLLFDRLYKQDICQKALDLDHDVARTVAQMRDNGFGFAMDAAKRFEHSLLLELDTIDRRITETFGNWIDNSGREIVFNPNSRDHITKKLQEVYGWIPAVFTETGKPKADEDVLASLQYPVSDDLNKRFTIKKRLAQLSTANCAWIKLARRDKYGTYAIHGSVNPSGTVSGRATHAYPNLAQVPKKDVPYGSDCRSLFIPRYGRKLIGIDLSGIELRCLAHYLAEFDEGDYAREVISGDIHEVNRKAAGLDTREQAKTFIYAFIYGAGNAKIGSIIGGDADSGKELTERFLRNLPQLAALKRRVKQLAVTGKLIGLDGRTLFVRSLHSALNLLLQGGGAIVAKMWIELGHRANLPLFILCAWIHDELQIEAREDDANLVGQGFVDVLEDVRETLKFKCMLDAKYKIGNNWYETH